MKYKVIFLVLLINFLLPLGEMPKQWDKPSLGQRNDISNTENSIVGIWNIDLDQIVAQYRKTPEYREAGEFAELGVEMIKGIFSLMKFEFKDNGVYILMGVPNQNGQTENFEGNWYQDNGFIILESIENGKAAEDITFKLSGSDILVPQDKSGEMFYLIREK